MFKHLLRYMPPMMYKNRDGALFGIFFPFAFGLIYLMVFTGLMSNVNNLETVSIAMVFEGSTTEIATAQTNIENIAVPGEFNDDDSLVPAESHEETPLMAYIEVASLEEGRELANDGSVVATVVVDNQDEAMNIALEVAPVAVNDFGASIVYSALSSFSSISSGITGAFEDAANSNNPLIAVGQVTQRVNDVQSNSYYPETVQSGVEGTNSNSIYFYAALAYLCIFFMSVGTDIVNQNEAYFSSEALRTTVSPVPKGKRFLASFISWGIPSLLVVYAVIALYYLNDIPLGNEWGRLLILMTLGVIVGLLLGTAVAGLLKNQGGLLSAVSIGLPLVMGALSGLMSQPIKVAINENAPWLNKINPVSLINDGIYYLNNYPTFDHYNQNVIILAIMAVVLLVVTILSIRRTDYASL